MLNRTVLVLHHRSSRGFTMIELIVAMALSLTLLGITFNLLDSLYNVSDGAITIADMDENLRAAVNLISRDLSGAGSGIPLGGIPLPGGGTATLINRPGPGALTFPNIGTLPVLTPGYNLGPLAGSINTDEITIIGVNPTSALNTFPLTSVAYTTTNATIVVNAGTNIASGASQVIPGDLIMLSNANGNALLTATAVNTATNTITFTDDDANDVLGLNQFPPQATTGTIANLRNVVTPFAWPAVNAYHLRMVSYYLDTTTPQKLLRQVGTVPAQQVALGIKVLQFSFDLADGVTVNQRVIATPNQIRKVNLSVTAQSDHPSRKSRLFYSNSVNTAITIQNLSFVNKY